MLDPWIIEEIRRQEELERLHEEERPAIEIQIIKMPERSPRHEDRDERGVVIINAW